MAAPDHEFFGLTMCAFDTEIATDPDGICLAVTGQAPQQRHHAKD